MEHLQISAAGVTPDGWMDIAYERFAQHLAQSHEVRPFAYDWRLSVADAADKFGAVLDASMTDAEQRQKPLRIVAHSLGGLVARLALKDRWPRFNAIQGSRLVQFGTPNAGSHSIAAVLTGRDGFVQMIERWLTGVLDGTRRHWALGHEIAQCGRLIKGYGATNERGKEYLEMLNRGLAEMRDTGEWYDIVATSLTEYNAQGQ